MRKILATGLICFTMAWFGSNLKGQGVHFSYLEFAPQSINPAYLGGFLGSYRGTGIYRSQYNNGDQVRGFKTFEFGIDVPIIRGFRKQDWIGEALALTLTQGEYSVLKTPTLVWDSAITLAWTKTNLGFDPWYSDCQHQPVN